MSTATLNKSSLFNVKSLLVYFDVCGLVISVIFIFYYFIFTVGDGVGLHIIGY